MNYLKIGKFVSTHGLKGEIKILSDLDEIDSLIKVNNTVYLGNEKIPYIIESHRKHQKYNMVILKGLNTIEEVMPYKGFDVYLNKEDITIDLVEDLIGYDVYNNGNYIGKVIELLRGVKYNLLVVSDSRIIIPNIDSFIVEINKNNKTIKTNYMI